MSKTIAKKMFGRTVKKERIFKNDGNTFSALWAAERYLTDEGWVYGSTCAKSDLVGFHDPSLNITQKWHNYDAECKRLIAGVMQSEDYRNGDVKVIYFE